MKSVSIVQAKNRLTELLYGVEEGTPVAITRRGRPVAVLLSDPEYRQLRSVAANAVDFGVWVQTWRSRLPEPFEGISADELKRWAEFGEPL